MDKDKIRSAAMRIIIILHKMKFTKVETEALLQVIRNLMDNPVLEADRDE